MNCNTIPRKVLRGTNHLTVTPGNPHFPTREAFRPTKGAEQPEVDDDPRQSSTTDSGT